MACSFGLPDRMVLVDLGLEFRVDCESPTSSRCRVSGRDSGRVVKVEGMSWRDGDELKKEKRAILISTRWCCMDDCGIHNRVYLLSDGTLLFSHDESGVDGAHRVIFDAETTERLKEVYERLARERYELYPA